MLGLICYDVGKIRSYMTQDQAKTVIHAYVTSKLDANNALLAGTPLELQTKLQLVQNAAARLITRNKKRDHVTPILYNLHWLPMEDWIIFKILVLTYKSLNDAGPVYLKSLLALYDPLLNLRSADDPLTLDILRTKLVLMATERSV